MNPFRLAAIGHYTVTADPENWVMNIIERVTGKPFVSRGPHYVGQHFKEDK